MSTFIQLEGTCNTRDIGGIDTIYKCKIKKNLLFRSDKLSNLTENDYDILRKRGIKQIIDFRSEKEKKREPNIIPNDFIYKEIQIELDKKILNDIKLSLKYSSPNRSEELMKKCNRDFIIKYSKQFSDFVKTIIKTKTPTLFHCSFGKDRTGFATAIIHHICGVSMKNIFKDYLLSNHYIKKNIENEYEKLYKILDIPKAETHKLLPLIIVNQAYLHDSFNSAKNIYGSFDNYLSYKLQISSNELTELKYYLLE